MKLLGVEVPDDVVDRYYEFACEEIKRNRAMKWSNIDLSWLPDVLYGGPIAAAPLLDKIACAICLQDAKAKPCPDCLDGCAIGFRREAKAAFAVVLASLREPSEDMIAEAHSVFDMVDYERGCEQFAKVWQAMLDQCAKEQGL